ncbi:MAG: hypothetical protein GY825_01665 [Phycisphaeraceae bacterium]|nr:hypothetical protein [Phycisphaeraceae bacterium]
MSVDADAVHARDDHQDELQRRRHFERRRRSLRRFRRGRSIGAIAGDA